MEELSPAEEKRLLEHEQTALICAKDIMVAYIRAGKLGKLPPDPFSNEARDIITRGLFELAQDIFTPLNEGAVWNTNLKWDVQSDSDGVDSV